MTFVVDQDLCIGCGACESTCPEVFGLVDEISQVKLDPVPEASQANALSAEDGCPVEAISHK
ncbi:MAG: ferredoxin [Kiritimatiellae bacterium]|nr:ferredoxin [Kiritimatiellia bacterium]